MNAHWTLGILIGLPICGLLLIAAVIVSLLARSAWREKPNSYDGNDLKWFWRWGVISITVSVVICLIAYFPWSPQYHQWRPVSGHVEATGNRLIADGKSMSQRFVLRINGQEYGVDDTRASLVKVGDQVTISCKRDWQYASTPGYVCRWAS